jgi:hypothetical protein
MFPESRRKFPESRRKFPESRRMFPESRLRSTRSQPITVNVPWIIPKVPWITPKGPWITPNVPWITAQVHPKSTNHGSGPPEVNPWTPSSSCHWSAIQHPAVNQSRRRHKYLTVAFECRRRWREEQGWSLWFR